MRLNGGFIGPKQTTTRTRAIGIWPLALQEGLTRTGIFPGTSVPVPAEYQVLTFSTAATLTITNNGSTSVNIFKTSGSSSWDTQSYCDTPFTAPCTIEFNKQAASGDNGLSYAMIGWNEDRTTDASYTSLDYASYPFQTVQYQVYHNGSLQGNYSAWSTSSKFYVSYKTDGYVYHYNGSTLLASYNYGAGKTVYIDSSLYSPNATYGGFSNIRVMKKAWNGTAYV